MKVTTYLSASKDVNHELGKHLGLKGDSLRKFTWAMSEVEIQGDLSPDGTFVITHVDGREVAK